MGFFGSLIRAGVSAAAGGLKGQNEGDDENYRRQEQARKDKLAEEHYQNEELLRRYAAERQQKEADATATWRTREGEHYDALEQPEWKRQGYGSFEAWEVDHKPREPREPVDHTDRRPEWKKQGYPSFQEWQADQPGHIKRENPGGTPEQKIADLNAAIDDSDREVGRAERDLPKPWSELPIERQQTTDSTAYAGSYDRAAAAVDSLRKQRDRFTSTRDSIVGARHGMSSPSSQPPGVDPSSLSAGAGHTGGTKPRPATPAMSPELPGGGQVYGDPAMSAALEEINRQYQHNLQWRGPNGERKDPEALRQRYLEAMAHVTGGAR